MNIFRQIKLALQLKELYGDIKEAYMKDPKTTLLGILGAIGIVISGYFTQHGIDINTGLLAVASAFFGFILKDGAIFKDIRATIMGAGIAAIAAGSAYLKQHGFDLQDLVITAIPILIGAAAKGFKPVSNTGGTTMKTLVILLSMMLLIAFAAPAFAAEPVMPTENDVVSLFPEATKFDGVGVYLFVAKDVGFGPSYTVARFLNLVNLDIQFASMSKGGSYVGGAGSVAIVDVLKKFGKNPPDMVLAFGPAVGLTGGYRTSIGDIKSGFDGGIQVKILKIDTAKLAKWLGL
jgi:hypothetical protein